MVGQRMKPQENVSFRLKTLCLGQKNSEKNFCFLRKKQFFLRETNVLLRVFLYQAYCFQPEGYIFLGFHPLTYHKPLDFDGFCFILPLQILLRDHP